MLRILHIDRSEMYRKFMKELVMRCGHTAKSVASKAQAREALANRDIDLVITALELEDGTVEDLLHELSGSGERELPVLVVSATDSLEQRERLFELGVAGYLIKGELSEEGFGRYLDSLAASDEISNFMRTFRVAVIDDSKLILKMVSRMLSLNGFTLIQLFEHPAELFERGLNFDLYLCDMVMPGMSGEQVVSRIRREQPDAIIISMSRFSGERSLSHILLAGADDYLHKPFEAPELVSRIKVNARSYQLKKRLEQMALTDGLTGLFNHKHCYERLEQEIQKRMRYNRALSIAMLDVDDFKQVNDRHGHRAGDEVLKGIAESLCITARAADTIGRYGGEEFIIILPETNLADAKKAAEKLRAAIEELRPAGLVVTASIGVAEHDGEENAVSLVSRADAKLYEAKNAGKNRIA